MKSGYNINVGEDEYWQLFNYFFSESCMKLTAYKFGLVKSICDQIYILLVSDELDNYYLSYEKLFQILRKLLEYSIGHKIKANVFQWEI